VSSTAARILISRMPPLNPHFYDVVLRWIQKEHPALAPVFDVCTPPFALPSNAEYTLHVPWLHDPLDRIDARAYDMARDLLRACDLRGVPSINPVDKHVNATKINAGARLTQAGIRTPRVVAVEFESSFRQNLCGMSPPAVLRENRWHQGDFVLIRSLEEAGSAQLDKFDEPVLAEFIDVQSKDGLYRKYRCFVMGDTVISHHLQVSEDWITHGKRRLKNAQTREEEIAYLVAPDPFEETMLAARKSLDLDYVAIDYGIGRDGKPVIWEANLYPMIHFSRFDMVYRNFSVDRTIAALVRFYLETAGVPVPAKLIEQSSYECFVM
jgi:glutathione synthase/RimK-type ligase-like ATP-grasp enzyme